MKIKTFFIVVAAIATLTGCRGVSDPETRAINSINAKSPEFVADTSKGKLFRIWIDMGASGRHDRVYFFEDTTNNTISINETMGSGKSSHTETIVVINGVEYIRK